MTTTAIKLPSVEQFPEAKYASPAVKVVSEHVAVEEELIDITTSIPMPSPPKKSSSSNRGQLRELKKIYGRSEEQQKLLDAYEKVFNDRNEDTATPGFVVVSGQPGVGKTALATGLKEVVQQRDKGFFVHWKFEQLNQLEAGEGFDDAFRDLCCQIRASDGCHAIRDALRAAGPADCSILLYMIPPLEMIIGKKEFEGHAKRSTETSGRHMHVIQHFFRSIGDCGQLVVLFDDIQFSDPCSLMILNKLIPDRNLNGVMFMATLGTQPNERFDSMMTSFKEGQLQITEIELQELQEETVNMMVSDVLHVDLDVCLPMTQFLSYHTKGNALFVVELLRLMYKKGVLVYNPASKSWDCVETKMACVYQCENFEALYANQVAECSDQLQEMLSTASCMGSRIDAKLLQMVTNLSLDDDLKIATEMGLIICTDQKKKLYKFAHSSVRNGAYALICKEERDAFHLDIGRKLWKQLSEEDLYENISIVLSQIKIGATLVKDQKERSQLATLSVRGAERALEWSGFYVAVGYLELGMQLLGEKCWREEYDLTLALHNSCAEVCYTIGSFSRAEELVDAVLCNARVFEHKIQAYCSRIIVCTSEDRMLEAIETGLDVLDMLGEKFTRAPTSRAVLRAYCGMRLKMRNKTPEMICRLPRMTDTHKVACMQVINLVISSSFMMRPNLVMLLVFRAMRITLDHGLCAISAMIFGVYGIILASTAKQIGRATRFGDLALSLVERFDAVEWMPRVNVCVYGSIHGWTKSLRDCIEPLERGMTTGFETGDNEFAILNGHIRCVYLFAIGEPLPNLKKEIGKFCQEMLSLGQHAMLQMLAPFMEMVEALGGDMASYQKYLDLTVAGETKYLKHQAIDSFWGGWLSFQKGFAGYVFEDYEFAASQVKLSRKMSSFPFNSIDMAQVHLIDALVHMAHYKKNRTHKRQTLRMARVCLNKTEQLARYNAPYCLGKVYLIKAEIASILSRHDAAYQHYVAACGILDSEGLLMEHAMAKELAGRCMLERGKKDDAAQYLKESVAIYTQWGATGKAKVLTTEFQSFVKTTTEEKCKTV